MLLAEIQSPSFPHTFGGNPTSVIPAYFWRESNLRHSRILLARIQPPSFPHAFGGNPVRQFTKLLYNVPFKRSTTVYYDGLRHIIPYYSWLTISKPLIEQIVHWICIFNSVNGASMHHFSAKRMREWQRYYFFILKTTVVFSPANSVEEPKNIT
ncbi:MAG: hypothetical protein ACI909_002461 [Planctomycetota bacterium]|jgi:hypothetical protein